MPLDLMFMGFGELGAAVLEGLAAVHRVGLVLTHRPDFTGLGDNDVLRVAEAEGLPTFLSPRAAEPELIPRVAGLRPDAIVSTNWRTLVPSALLGLPRLGAINIHDALLPKYGGFGAVNWAIRNGEAETGLTVHLMSGEFDTGDIIAQERVPIGVEDTATDVYHRLLIRYPGLVLRGLSLLNEGYRGQPQDLSQSVFYHRIAPRDTRADWNQSSLELYNLIRAQSDPFLNARTDYEGSELLLKRAKLPKRAYCGTPGRLICHAEEGVAVACGGPGKVGACGIILMEVQPPGQSPIAARDFFPKMGGYLGHP
ncbi:methionyl-tRNA formyltransferase [Stigmatella sp. ncwal1]|uniref:Methionyl-tRNA formyltransferase n=1 Tax=Stigmatella ashevillensis TaxID=2995309 RepID=A0ABT5DAV1_9BACT|nr:methionyl-tRNA formyltransferase [Stigmatella ashevillena]MDC0710240.1 methionyl-tRNA formyltransferase [Stigmatella ashevillena]